MAPSLVNFCSVTTLLLLTSSPFSAAQTTAPALAPASATCNGIFLSYTYTAGTQIKPTVTVPKNQPYRFESTLTVLNNAAEELKAWRVFVGFQHNEFLFSASNAVLTDGSGLPSNVTNGTVFAGYPSADLKSAIETAGDVTQMQVRVMLVGTQFGVKPPAVPMPANISLANDGFVCPSPTMQGTSDMQVCCVKDDTNNGTNLDAAEEFLSLQRGDLTIMYDVTRTYTSKYNARVTMEIHNPIGRLDNWRLSFDWMRQEFIYSMKGAYPSVVDSSDCIFGTQGKYYRDMDFSTVLNCQRNPTIIDLPPTKANDTILGLVPGCCRNGTVLPPSMDPTRSKSVFEMQVFKMEPDLNRSVLFPPQNWRIDGTMNPDYQCRPPIRVDPTHFSTDPSLPSNTSAVASWQITCNITRAVSSPKCCVSFSAYYNNSVVPCPTCACGCPSTTAAARTCSATAPAILLPPEALLVPFENRTELAVAWSDLKHRTVPNPVPCGDNCGVSINWHLFTDYTRGWTARVTVFNWDETAYPDWFTAVEMDRAAPGFEAVYSFNGTVMVVGGKNTTIFMQGKLGLNYLVGETDAEDPNKDLRNPGKQQSVMSFKKKNTPGIDVVGGDGFPTKVYFNGEECALPSVYPTGGGSRIVSGLVYYVVLGFLVSFVRR